MKRISAIFKETDACLKTKFYDELVSLVDEEKKYFDQLYRDNEKNTAQKESETVTELVTKEEHAVEAAPRRRSAIVGPVETGLSEEKISLLRGWSKLSDIERSLIKDVILDTDGSVKDIIWVECPETENLLACDCGLPSPESFSVCVKCGASFVEND